MEERRKATQRVTAIDVQNVTRLFGATPALRGVTLQLAAGTITVLSGPNGAGKSTLLAILGTQLKPTRGTVRFLDAQGHAVAQNGVRAQLGWVSHASRSYQQLTGRQNVQLAAEVHGVDPSWYDAVAERTGLGKFADRPVATLSRGQAQRVALARALIHHPTVLLLDEPWTGLDAHSSKLLEKVVLQERDRGALVVIVSHVAQLAERLVAQDVQLVQGRCSVLSDRSRAS